MLSPDFPILLGAVANAMRQEKEIKDIRIGKKAFIIHRLPYCIWRKSQRFIL